MISVLFISASSPAAATTECHARKGGDWSYWSWREIEGRRCWYRGHRGLNKHMLHWPAATAEPVRTARPSPPRPSPPPVAAADAGATLNTISGRWPEADWTDVTQHLFVTTAAVTATASSPRVKHDDANNAGANHDRRHPPATPKNDTDQGRSPAVTLAVLAVSLGMIGAGAFLIRMRT
jgi:hypothetical protein